MPRRRWGRDSSCRVGPPAEAPADRGRRLAAPAATAGWPGHGWPGITISRTAAGGPGEGGGAACCTGTPHKAPRSEGLAVTLALSRRPTRQREATALTLFLDLG